MLKHHIFYFLVIANLLSFGQGSRFDMLLKRKGCTDTVNSIVNYKNYKIVVFNDCINSYFVSRSRFKYHTDMEHNLCDSVVSNTVNKKKIINHVKNLESFFRDSVEKKFDTDSLEAYVIQLIGYENHGKREILFRLGLYNETSWETEYERNLWKKRGQGGAYYRYGPNYSIINLYYDVESQSFVEGITNLGRDTIAFSPKREYCEQTFWRLSQFAIKSCSKTESNLDSLNKKQIESFLNVVTSRLRNNIEHSQWSNELLFKVLQKYPREVLSILDSYSSNIDKSYILEELRNPIHDLIPLDEVLKEVKKSGFSSRSDDVLKALEYAKSKNE